MVEYKSQDGQPTGKKRKFISIGIFMFFSILLIKGNCILYIIIYLLILNGTFLLTYTRRKSTDEMAAVKNQMLYQKYCRASANNKCLYPFKLTVRRALLNFYDLFSDWCEAMALFPPTSLWINAVWGFFIPGKGFFYKTLWSLEWFSNWCWLEDALGQSNRRFYKY